MSHIFYLIYKPTEKYFFTLGGLLPDNEFWVWLLAVQITDLVFGPGRAGFTEEMIDLLQHLILRHNVLTEEVLRLDKCVVTVHNLLHMTEDIDRFSAPDNYRCYGFERAVSMFIGQATSETSSVHMQKQNAVEGFSNSLTSSTNSNHSQKFQKENW